jgi:hypothetical protein
LSDATRPGAPTPTSHTAATLVRVLASVVDLVATDHDPVAHEVAVQRAVEAGASALTGLAESDPERTSVALDALSEVVEDLPGEDPTLFDRWRQQVRALTPALVTARQVVTRMEAMVDEFGRLARLSGAPAAASLVPRAAAGDAPEVEP